MYNFVALQKERKTMSQSWFQRAKKPVEPHKTHCENAKKRPTRNGIGTPYLYIDVQTRPRFDFSNTLQAHNTNDKLIKTTC